MNENSEKQLIGIVPALDAKVRDLADAFGKQFPDDELEVVQGVRSYADQAKEYAQGRTAPGKIVTHAPPGHSMHEYGFAVDVCPVSLKSKTNWDPTNPMWAWLAQKGVDLGLTVGAHFVHCPPDLPHFQLTGRFPPSPDQEMRELYAVLGMKSVWVESGLFVVPETQNA